MRGRLRKAFSLLELLLVIFIISLVYFLGFSGAEKEVKKETRITPLNLKRTLLNTPELKGGGTFLCIDHCKKCYMRKDISTPFQAYEGNIDLQNARSYIIDKDDNIQEVEFGRYQDQKICLRYEIYPNGSSSQLILETSKGIFYLPTFFGETKKVNSLDEAETLWLQYSNAVSRQGDFY